MWAELEEVVNVYRHLLTLEEQIRQGQEVMAEAEESSAGDDAPQPRSEAPDEGAVGNVTAEKVDTTDD